ncbi:MAG: uracil-DNA glycosylase [Pseudomonadales bacterium]
MVATVSARLAECVDCPRLVALRKEVRRQYPEYHAGPVPAWGRRDARLLIVGLAPGMHGANRTGQPFTGDASGTFLFRALAKAGFSTHPDACEARLINTRITNAVKCLPPANKPIAAELNQCRTYLEEELDVLRGRTHRRPRCVLCLGRLAHEAVGRALAENIPLFAHGRHSEITAQFWLADTYHPSRQNTNTGRLTESMLDGVLRRVAELLDG